MKKSVLSFIKSRLGFFRLFYWFPGVATIIAGGLAAVMLEGWPRFLLVTVLLLCGLACFIWNRPGRVMRALVHQSPTPRLLTDAQPRMIAASTPFTALFAQADMSAFDHFIDWLRQRAPHDLAAASLLDMTRHPTLTAVVRRDDHSLLRIHRFPAGNSGHWMWNITRMNASEIDHACPLDIGVFDYFLTMLDAPVGLYSLDHDGCLRTVNATLAGWLGMEASQMRGRPPADFITLAKTDQGKDRPENRDGCTPVLLRTHVGPMVNALLLERQAKTQDGASLTWGMVCNAIPESESERNLRTGLRRFQKLFEIAPAGIALLDVDGGIIECNQAMSALLGAGAQTHKESIHSFAVPGHRKKFDDLITALVKDGKGQYSFDAEFPVDGKNEVRIGRFFAGGLENDNGEITGLVLHGLDVTEQERLEKQFVQSQKMQAIGQLAGGIAHDFNNLLTAMLGFCDLLLQRHQPGEQSFADVMQIKQNANRAGNLVRQLLAFSRQQTVHPKVLNPTDVLSDTSRLLSRLIGEHVTLDMQYGRDVGLIRMDLSQVEQVIINLAVNARDAMPDGGRLTIRVHNATVDTPVHDGEDVMSAGDYVLIEVCDTGMGIEPEDMSRIFEPFYSTKAVGSGTGLGLSTVEGIIRQSGSHIFADSTPGEGTRFKIYIPRYNPAQNRALESVLDGQKVEGVGDLTGASSILLVEDETAVRLVAARSLRSKGYTVIEARSGEAAVELIKRGEADINLLITDIMMPDMDGPTLIDWVQENRPHVPVICISGYAEESVREGMTQSEDIAFLSKPFTLKQLAGEVKKALSESEE